MKSLAEPGSDSQKNSSKKSIKELEIKAKRIAETFNTDDFYKFFDAITAKYTLKPTGKRKYHRSSTLSKAEVMLIMILFHDSGYRCFKHFYLDNFLFFF